MRSYLGPLKNPIHLTFPIYTAIKTINFLKHLQFYKIRYCRVKKNPFQHVRLPKVPKSEIRVFSEQECIRMIDDAYATLGDMPYGQPMTAMAAGASDNTWGIGSKAPWLNVHNVSNVGRDARMFAWLRRQYSLSNPCPSINVEPFYPGWNNKPSEPLNDSEMAQFMMYGSVLNGGFGGHAWGDDYYSGNRKFGGDPHVNGFNKWCAASMGHLKDFILDKGHDYRKLAPALSPLVDNQQEFLCLALSPDKSFGLGFISAKMKTSDIQHLKPNMTYIFQYWDIDRGGWQNQSKLKTDADGVLKLPAKPDARGWAYRLKIP